MTRQGKSASTKIAGQDDEVLERLYRLHRDGIRRYIARMFGAGPPDPDDVAQVAFERYVALEDRSSIDNPQAFLMRSARNYVLDERRRQTVRANFRQSFEAMADQTDDIDAERVFSSRERWQILDHTIRNLETRQQEVLIMNRIHGLTYAEIARRKGFSATLVKTLVAQALLACERALREADGK